MSYTRKSVLIGLAVLTSAGSASAQNLHPWYISGGIAAAFLSDPDSVIQNAPTPGATLFITNGLRDSGFGGQVALGRAIGPVRLEIEIGRTDTRATTYNVTSPIVATLPQSGGDKVTRYMANAYYDVPLEQFPLRPYVGFGVGQVDVHVTTKASRPFGPPTPPSQLIDDSVEGFAWQLMAGAELPIASRVALTAQYRWLDAGKLGGHDTRGQPFSTKISGHNIDVGVRFRF